MTAFSNSFSKVKKIDPFDSNALGEWKADKKSSNKDLLAFIRSAEIEIPEQYQQEWIDPITFQKKKIWGKVILTERKLINKHNSQESVQRHMEPCLKGSHVIDAI